jgi:pilus assembly protein Flp/PilA
MTRLTRNLAARLAATRAAASDDRGATAVEYGLMVALIAVVIIAAVMALGDNVSAMFGGVADEVQGTTP